MKEALKLALEALNNSFDLVSNAAREAESLYGKYQSRLARVQGLVALEAAHQRAIKALEEALAKQEHEHERFHVATIGNWGRIEWVEGIFPSVGDKMYSAPPQGDKT